MADILFTTPDDLDRAVHVARDLDGEQRAVGIETAAKATPEKMVVDSDRGFRQPGQFGHHALCSRWRLRSQPDIAAVLRVMDGTVHRLHRGMCEERHLVHGVKPLRRASEGLVSVTLVSCHSSGVPGRLFELTDNRCHLDARVRSVIPLNRCGLEALPGCPHVIGDDGDGFVDVDDLAHASHRQSRSFVHLSRSSAKHGRDGDRRDLHSRQPDVDTKLGAAVDLFRAFNTFG